MVQFFLHFVSKIELWMVFKQTGVMLVISKKRQQVEKDFKYCGFKNTTDDNGNCGYDPGEGKTAEPCYQKIKTQINNHMYSLRAATIVMLIVEVVLFVCACVLACSRNKSDDDGIAIFENI